MNRSGRRARERAILEIVRSSPISTQAELVSALRSQGFSVTQATVSRDIRRLGIVKLRGDNGRPRYAEPDDAAPPPVARRLLETALREFALGVDVGDALLAIRTQTGCANAVAVAIDEAELEGVVATLAGDDTILILARDREDRARLVEALRDLGDL